MEINPYLNAAVTKAVGSTQSYGYIAAGAQYVGKYGFDVEQLKSTGLVSAEAEPTINRVILVFGQAKTV